MGKEKLIRLNLAVTKQTRRNLERLRKQTNHKTLSATITHAIALYDYFREQKEKGNRILLQYRNDEIREIATKPLL